MAQKSRAKMNIPMCMACVLLCLTLFSTYLTGGLYARYVSRDDSEDSARVAAFSVDLSSNTDHVDIRLEQNETDGSYIFRVHNESEVAIKYSVILTFSKDIPSYVNVTLNGSVGTKPDGAADKLLFEDVATIAPNGPVVENTIVFEVNNVDSLLDDATGQNYNFEVDFSASVKCEQID